MIRILHPRFLAYSRDLDLFNILRFVQDNDVIVVVLHFPFKIFLVEFGVIGIYDLRSPLRVPFKDLAPASTIAAI